MLATTSELSWLTRATAVSSDGLKSEAKRDTVASILHTKRAYIQKIQKIIYSFRAEYIHMSEAPVKKKPGRPPKNPAPTTIPTIDGIVSSPKNEDAVAELICNDPKIFKQLLSLFKKMGVEDVNISFTPTSMELTA